MMQIEKKEIQGILEDLEKKNKIIERQDLKGVPGEYVGTAIYGYVIDQLKGLINR